MSIEKLKSELQASLSFDEKEAKVAASVMCMPMLRSMISRTEAFHYCVEAACLEHAKHARTAQMLLEAIEALEYIADKMVWDTELELKAAAREALDKLSKVSE